MVDEPVVRCRGISRSFLDEDGGRTTVLRNVDLDVRSGELLVLIGPSGCGKSTLLNLIAGFDKPDDGRVEVSGRRVTGPGPDKAMVFQDYALLPWLDACGNVEIGLRLQGLNAASRRREAEMMLELVGLKDAAKRPVYKLSGGMQQRVSIARALALKPKVLLMDEPFGALDVFQRGTMHRELLRIWRSMGTTIIFVTHSLDEAVFLATRVVAMRPKTNGLAGELIVDLPEARDPMSHDFVAHKQTLLGYISRDDSVDAIKVHAIE